VWMLFVQPWEERDLQARFGIEYAQYRSAVRCWMPRLHPYRGVSEASEKPDC
jgi:protein-S-isoprenylcysteine O-methyltransferase Ste14